DPDKPELNTEDHYAYIVGYPDGNVKPEGNITRAEVATIFFRLLTDESRDEFWSQTNPYSDVSEDDWYNNAVSTLTNAGLIYGYEDGTFKPNGNITRAEFATIAVRFFEATYEGENLFPDIDGHWAQDYINEAANAGIVDGYPDGTFGPQKRITRAEAMTMVNRTIDRHPHEDHLLADMIVWPDNPETAWYYEQVQEATNSHEYTMNTDDEQNPYEIWTELLPVRDWAQLEKEWSDAHSGQSGGDVV
ncbi:MAG: S-layer homology domain-containing protein, partial [Evtepia sp.]|nr:S-layer homology domain-containing protein [Evtepia sp.]